LQTVYLHCKFPHLWIFITCRTFPWASLISLNVIYLVTFHSFDTDCWINSKRCTQFESSTPFVNMTFRSRDRNPENWVRSNPHREIAISLFLNVICTKTVRNNNKLIADICWEYWYANVDGTKIYLNERLKALKMVIFILDRNILLIFTVKFGMLLVQLLNKHNNVFFYHTVGKVVLLNLYSACFSKVLTFT
jgi:hypothetical protein